MGLLSNLFKPKPISDISTRDIVESIKTNLGTLAEAPRVKQELNELAQACMREVSGNKLLRKPWPGILVVVEGIDGSGKTELVKELASRSYPVQGRNGVPVVVRQPGGDAYAESVRDVCRNANVDSYIQTLVYTSALYSSFNTMALPVLLEGGIVIMDRFFNSTYTYQAIAGEQEELMINLLSHIPGFRHPDLTIYLDLPLEVAMARLDGRDRNRDRYEGMAFKSKQRVKEAYDLVHGVVPQTNLLDHDLVFEKLTQYRAINNTSLSYEKDPNRTVLIDATLSQVGVAAVAYTAIANYLWRVK